MTALYVMPLADVGGGIKPSDGAQLFFFEDDGVTPKDTHTTKAATIANSNPVIANANGVFPEIYITGDYKVTLKDKNNVQIFGLIPINELAVVTDNVFVKNLVTLAIGVADSTLVDGDAISLKESTVGDGGGGPWDAVDLTTVTLGVGRVASTGGQVPALALVQRDIEIRTIAFDTPTVLVTVPTDFPDLQSAVDFYLNSATKDNVSVEVQIESGHQLTGGVGVYNANAAHIVVTSIDATVTLDAGFVGVLGVAAGNINGDAVSNPLFYGFNAGLPQLKCLIDMGNLHGTGYYGVNSRGFVHPGAGVINAGSRGIQWRSGYIYAVSSNFNGANAAGVRFHQGASGSVGSATFNDCCKTSGDSAAIYVSRGCAMEARFATATGSTTGGLTCRRSIVSAGDVDVSGAGTHGVRCESVGAVDFIGGTASNCTGNGVVVGQNGKVSAQSAVVKNNTGTDFSILAGGVIGINGATETTAGFQKPADYSGIIYFNIQSNQGLVINDAGLPLIANAVSSDFTTRRMADGRQDVHGTVDLTVGTATIISGVVTFPQAFINGSYVATVTLSAAAGKWASSSDRNKVAFIGITQTGTTTMNVEVHVVTGETFTGAFINDVQVVAVGRWIT